VVITVAPSAALGEAAFDVLWLLVSENLEGLEGVVVITILVEFVDVANLERVAEVVPLLFASTFFVAWSRASKDIASILLNQVGAQNMLPQYPLLLLDVEGNVVDAAEPTGQPCRIALLNVPQTAQDAAQEALGSSLLSVLRILLGFPCLRDS